MDELTSALYDIAGVKPPQAAIQEDPAGRDVFVKIKGSPLAVEHAVECYFKNYAPAGYGTHIFNDIEEDGIRIVRITRYRSCD